MLLKIILRLSVLALCVIPITSYGGWFEVEKIYPSITAWLLDLIKDNPGTFIAVVIIGPVLAYLCRNSK